MYPEGKVPTIPFYSESGVGIFQATEGAAGLDLPVYDERLENGEWGNNGVLILKPMESKIIKTGVYMAIPDGCVGILDMRSSSSKKKLDLLCHTIDNDYRGNIRLSVINLNSEPVTIKNGQSIAQIIILPRLFCKTQQVANVDALPQTKRGDGGYGSTGRNI
jgi:deoxyuridine 5'-triphosphate nucleotidohydrolase